MINLPHQALLEESAQDDTHTGQIIGAAKSALFLTVHDQQTARIVHYTPTAL
jgi:hypothetical protein